MADINWGLLDPKLPGRFAAIPQQMEQENIKNALTAMQFQQGANQNKLTGMQVRQAEQNMLRQDQLRKILSAGGKPEDLVNQLTAGGFLTEARSLAESQAKVNKDTREGRAAALKAATDKMKFFTDRMARINDPQAAAQLLVMQFNDPDLKDIMGSVPLEAALSEIPTDTKAFQQWKTEYVGGAPLLIERSKPREVSPGATLVSGDRPIYTAPTAPRQPTGDLALYEAAKAAGYKGTIMDFVREKAAAGRMPPQPTQPIVITSPDGTVRLVDRSGNITANLGPVGAQSATFQKTKATREQMTRDLNQTISELENITKDGGLIDQSTGSGVGKAVDFAAGLFGAAPAGAVAAARLQPIADLPLKMIPRFEGPQSDKDTQSYKEAAGQLANTALPNSVRKAAAKEILRLMKIRKGQFVTQEMAAEGIQPQSGGVVDFGNLK